MKLSAPSAATGRDEIMTELATTPAHADAALAVYLEPLARDARVLLFDAEDGAVGTRLGRVSAELEQLKPKALMGQAGRAPRLPFPDRCFDLVVVVDGGGLPEGAAARGVLTELARVLARQGLVAVAVPDSPRRTRRGERPGDGGLLAALLSTWKNVRTLTQTPLAGFALVDLGRDRPAELSVDSRLVRGTTVESLRRVHVAGDAALPDEGRLWVEVPASRVAPEAPPAVDPRIYESLRRAEDDAREALRRESELLRELEHLRRSEEQAVHLEKRARSFEEKLLAAEADYDDAVAKVRYFEGQVTERERAYHKEREVRERLERELSRAESAVAKAEAIAQKAESKLARHAADGAKAEADANALRTELDDVEGRLREAGQAVLAAQADTKRAETVARDLVEELRRFEHGALERAEHDALVESLTAERDRAVARTLEAEVARESAQLRADELRAELLQLDARARAYASDSGALESAKSALVEAERERGTLEALLAEARAELILVGQRADGLRAELDQASALAVSLAQEASRAQPAPASEPLPTYTPAAILSLDGEIKGLRLRLDETERARKAEVRRATEASRRAERTESELVDSRNAAHIREASLERRVEELSQALRAAAENTVVAPKFVLGDTEELRVALARADQRIDDLSRELDEADRIAAVHAEDADRLDTLEAELESARRHMDELDDDVRARDEEMRRLRLETADQVSAAETRIEEARRREVEARSERDAAHAALGETKGMLTQLAQRFGLEEAEPAALIDALTQQTVQPSVVDALRAALSEAQTERIRAEERAAQLERELSDRRRDAHVEPGAPEPQSFD
jgi:SAM-dependent methyltransferase